MSSAWPCVQICRDWLGRLLSGKIKYRPFLGLAFVANQNFVLLAGLAGGFEVDVQFFGIGGKTPLFAVHLNARDGQVHGIKIELPQAVAQRGKRVRDLADDLALFQVETQLDASMSQVVVTAGSKRLVGKRHGNQLQRMPPAATRRRPEARPRAAPD